MSDAAVLDLPSVREEGWRWSHPAGIAAAAAGERAGAAIDPAGWFLDIEGPRLAFVDGVFAPAHSVPGPVGVRPMALSTEHPLGSRTAGAEGWAIEVGAGQAVTGIQVVHVSTGGENHVPARIVLGGDSVASVVETHVGRGWANRLTQVELARSARLQRAVRLLHDDGFVTLRDEVTVGEGASHVAIVLGAGDAGARIDGHIDIVGAGAFAEMGGALLTRGDRRQECAVAIHHGEPSGSSQQIWRAVAADTSHASLAARVEVAQHAQKTDGEQSLRGLLLDRRAVVNLKPELEIFADDVKCAHGATVGELDARSLFYLESRGIAPARARALLTRAFVADAIDRIGDETARAAFAADADAWLEAAL